MKGKIAKILPFSSVDGSGNRTIIFFQGCNFNCKYCHNPETISLNFQDEQIMGKEMTIDEIVEFVEKYKDFTRGVTISGGECTLDFFFLINLVKKLKEKGSHILLDTNGYIEREKLREIEPYCDGFMLDIKSFIEDEHIMLTGKSNRKVLETFAFLAQKQKIYEVRTVIVDKLLDNEKNVDNISRLIKSYDKNIRYKLIKFRKNGVRDNVEIMETPSDNLMEKLKEIAKNHKLKNIILT